MLLFIHCFQKFDYFSVLELVPQSIWAHNYKIMVIYFKTGDFWFIDNNLVILLRILGLIVSKGAGCWQSTRKNPQWSNNHVIRSIRDLGDGSCLVNFATCFDNSFLLVRIWRFMIFADLIAFVKLLTDQYSSGVSKVSCVTNVIVNEHYKSATSTVVTLLFPFTVSFNKSLPESSRYIFSPVTVKKVLMQLFF